MGREATSVLQGSVLGVMAGAISVAGVMAGTGAVVAAIERAGVVECATGGLIIGSIAGAAGGAIGGWSRCSTSRLVSVSRAATASAFAALIVWFGVWGPPLDRLAILALVLVGLCGGVAIGDRVARTFVFAKARSYGASSSRNPSSMG
jgi:hypothetical protein